MPRDYKHTAKKKKRRRKKSRTQVWPWIASAAAGALFAGTGVYVYREVAESPAGTPAPPAVTDEGEPSPRPAPPADRKAGKTETDTPEFEFYTLLPEIEVEITDEELGAALKALPERRHKGPYILQAGSFRRFEEADNMKARLALIGIEARIQTVTINDQSTWYRVRIGPYKTLKDLEPVRSRLRRNDIEFMLMSVKG